MVKRKTWLTLIPTVTVAALILSGCDNESGVTKEYKDAKSMVLDIMKSEEGKKAISEATKGGGDEGGDSSGGDQGGGQGGQGGGQSGGAKASGQGGAQMLSSSDSNQLKMVVTEVMTSDANNRKFLQNLMKDPKFASDFAKAIKQQNKQLQVELLKDPEYQKDMLDVMKNPDFSKIVQDALKTISNRQQTKLIVQDTLQSPMFKAELITLLKKAVEEQLQEPEKKGQEKDKQKEGGDQGGQDKEKSEGDQGKDKSKEESGSGDQ
ncbi:spore germination lipoprotein GerD [Paenibacillus sp. N1-5-1-14]|uniref:spore germination lipoprotein GerD n=1 Tax=Paenibacillus radicibacter TaxID=2972488 RepID=UPI0021598484|nr:spore germination lipoprotein GerD [Paenibacillus radicibacter]MCR8645758.1 spore germination lipoprotein GerD [Paenibacillus radicibacter]